MSIWKNQIIQFCFPQQLACSDLSFYPSHFQVSKAWIYEPTCERADFQTGEKDFRNCWWYQASSLGGFKLGYPLLFLFQLPSLQVQVFCAGNNSLLTIKYQHLIITTCPGGFWILFQPQQCLTAGAWWVLSRYLQHPSLKSPCVLLFLPQILAQLLGPAGGKGMG